jgi:hypothetical protein
MVIQNWFCCITCHYRSLCKTISFWSRDYTIVNLRDYSETFNL